MTNDADAPETRSSRLSLAQQALVNALAVLALNTQRPDVNARTLDLLTEILPEARKDPPWGFDAILRAAGDCAEYHRARQAGEVPARDWWFAVSPLAHALYPFFEGRALRAAEDLSKARGAS